MSARTVENAPDKFFIYGDVLYPKKFEPGNGFGVPHVPSITWPSNLTTPSRSQSAPSSSSVRTMLWCPSLAAGLPSRRRQKFSNMPGTSPSGLFNKDLDGSVYQDTSRYFCISDIVKTRKWQVTESSILICWSVFIWWKNPPECCACKSSSEPVLTPNRPPNIKCIFPAFFGDRLGGKDGCLGTHNSPTEEEGCLEVFLYEAAKNSELFFKNSISKLKN